MPCGGLEGLTGKMPVSRGPAKERRDAEICAARQFARRGRRAPLRIRRCDSARGGAGGLQPGDWGQRRAFGIDGGSTAVDDIPSLSVEYLSRLQPVLSFAVG